MAIKVEVKSSAVIHREGVSRGTGKPYSLDEQRAWLHGAKDYPTEVSIVLEPGQVPFAPGYYLAGAECCFVDRYGTVSLRLSKMKPLRTAAAA